MKVSQRIWDHMPDGTPVYVTELSAENGTAAEVLDLGGVLLRLKILDQQGNVKDVVPGPACARDILFSPPFMDSLLGRYANRIGGARLQIDNRQYPLEANDGPNTLHSGSGCYAQKLFQSRAWADEDGAHVCLQYQDQGQGGFPGNVQVQVTYTLTPMQRLILDYQATPDQTTPINLTNHAYFNVGGMDCGNVRSQYIRLNADFYMPNHPNCLQNGEIRQVQDTPFDFRQYRQMKNTLASTDPQITNAGGLDHNFCIRGQGMREAAAMVDAQTGRKMTVYTDAPCIQVYTANMDVPVLGKDGRAYQRNAACCFETQQYPDSMQYSHFPKCLYKPGQVFHTVTAFQFGMASAEELAAIRLEEKR